MPRLVFLGSGSIIPSKTRFSSGILVQTGKSENILMDIGPGVIEKLRRLSLDVTTISHVLVTHLHVDHVCDLIPLLKILSLLGGHVEIYGPPGISVFLDLLTSDQRLFGYLSDLRCRSVMEVRELWRDSVELKPGIAIRTTPVNHFHGIAFRLELEEVSITYSGDSAPDPRLIDLARGTDVLIHECSFPASKLKGKHTSAEDLLRLASEIKPKILILTHLYPEMEEALPSYLQIFSEKLACRIYAPKDLDVIDV
ncbi:MAG: MBL fold metallo-hydrolase [Thaumarchaeota archaeon]|nr:MBL fold metallo-hydrolase [Nitrososphaerota archaeon]